MWAPRREHYRLLKTVHHRLVQRLIGYRRMRGTYQQLSYAQHLKKTGCQSAEAMVRQRQLLFTSVLDRQPDKRLPKQLAYTQGGGDRIQDQGSPSETG